MIPGFEHLNEEVRKWVDQLRLWFSKTATEKQKEPHRTASYRRVNAATALMKPHFTNSLNGDNPSFPDQKVETEGPVGARENYPQMSSYVPEQLEVNLISFL